MERNYTKIKRVLYFAPDCPMDTAAGNITRFKQMLSYLNEAKNYEVDFISVEGWWYHWSENSIAKFKEQFPNINLFLINRKIENKSFWETLWEYKIPNILPKIIRLFSKKPLNDFFTPYFIRQFRKLVNDKKYDKIIISYALWGKLAKEVKYPTHLILDTHDFLTAQRRDEKDKIGYYFQSEMEIINLFDEIWTFSSEEKYIFEQFSDKKVVHLPIAFQQYPLLKKENYTYDIVYVASDNFHNVRSIHWFLQNVVPILNPKYKIHIIGKICTKIKNHPDNVILHGEVNSLSEIYQKTKLTICPMLSGTGIKIKVLESLSYNIPIVTNERGVDGLVNKTNNGCWVANTAEGFAHAIHTLLEGDTIYENYQKEAFNFFSKNHNLNSEKRFFSELLS